MLKLAVCIAALAASACSASSTGNSGGDAGDGAAPGPFDGRWTCTATAPLVVTAPPSLAGTYTPSSDAYAVQMSTNVDGTLTALIGALDGGVTCPKICVVSGSTATFTGQTCPLVFSGTTLVETFTSGAFTVSGSTMTDIGTASVAGTVPVDGGAGTFAGTIAFDGNCTR